MTEIINKDFWVLTTRKYMFPLSCEYKLLYYLVKGWLCFWLCYFLCLFICLSVCLAPGLYLQSNGRIRMKLLPEVCLRNNPLNFGDDSDYDPDRGCRSDANDIRCPDWSLTSNYPITNCTPDICTTSEHLEDYPLEMKSSTHGEIVSWGLSHETNYVRSSPCVLRFQKFDILYFCARSSNQPLSKYLFSISLIVILQVKRSEFRNTKRNI